ncbi:hypothetical protein C0Q70_08480 [Pomacea canaliculata]|uniref:Vacuole membrane protein 1 n=1 Tax=Pomacea canaliculata TaxID=400727 RepID=A0A2T7PHY9_POMCA|nr:hypothetical protein C0Q70_08480 [Pomacea canaliculata]
MATMRQRGTSESNGVHKSQHTEVDDFSKVKKIVEMERQEREQLVLWRQPLSTLHYFSLEAVFLAQALCIRLWRRKKTVALSLVVMSIAYLIYNLEGQHQTGPHIASVTLAAYECKSVDFPEPPYPNELVCPEKEDERVSMWTIMSKVRMEAIMWGAGTAIGELPPYFMARAARLSGAGLEDDDFEEIEELIHEKKEHPEELGIMEKAKLYVHNMVQKVGFFGILACASIPNPLFDLAGITCGHFLIPFWTFFGATLIGKAIIKMHIQKLFVIFLFSVHHVEKVIQLMGALPGVGKSLQTPFRDWLEKQRLKLHHKPGGGGTDSDGNLLSFIFEKVVLVMVFYFILSIINSMAQSYHKRRCRIQHALEKAEVINVTKVIKSSKD